MTLDEAVTQLKRDPEHPTTAEVEGLIVELRCKGRRTAGDVFGEIGPWEGETPEELTTLLREARREGVDPGNRDRCLCNLRCEDVHK